MAKICSLLCILSNLLKIPILRKCGCKVMCISCVTCQYQLPDLYIYQTTVRCPYNAVNIFTNIHKIHHIAPPLGPGMECLLWIQRPIDILPQFLQAFMQYLTILDHIITALGSIILIGATELITILFCFGANRRWFHWSISGRIWLCRKIFSVKCRGRA